LNDRLFRHEQRRAISNDRVGDDVSRRRDAHDHRRRRRRESGVRGDDRAAARNEDARRFCFRSARKQRDNRAQSAARHRDNSANARLV
jgi:hypothetical protein